MGAGSEHNLAYRLRTSEVEMLRAEHLLEAHLKINARVQAAAAYAYAGEVGGGANTKGGERKCRLVFLESRGSPMRCFRTPRPWTSSVT